MKSVSCAFSSHIRNYTITRRVLNLPTLARFFPSLCQFARGFANSATTMSGKKACVLLAQGAEEMEAVIAIDCLRRAKIDVTVAGVDATRVKCSRGVVIDADKPLADVENELFDVIVLPGGLQGAKTLSSNTTVGKMLKSQESSGRIVAAICAAPMALAAHGIAKGKNVTIYPSMESHLAEYKCKEDKVVVDGNLITSRGPGTALNFALQIIKELLGEDAAKSVAQPMLIEF
ncbi:protein DJ-1-like [Tropilaelaps mercedesae]|uniref:Protein DJ-1-like n=1 Tax=Tropilaelaps mercedesae TaxID=418985 RepID=A0A1V9Y0K1_9ACAR|nr:protein DJ-1-like [Tropilaelaps mercedesae]